MDISSIVVHALSTFGFEKVFHSLWEELKPEERERVQQLIKAEASGENAIAIGNATASGKGSVAIGATDARGNVNLTTPLNIQSGETRVIIS